MIDEIDDGLVILVPRRSSEPCRVARRDSMQCAPCRGYDLLGSASMRRLSLLPRAATPTRDDGIALSIIGEAKIQTNLAPAIALPC